jgi:hypothetical protein
MFATYRAEFDDLEASLQDLQIRDAALSVMRDLIDWQMRSASHSGKFRSRSAAPIG